MKQCVADWIAWIIISHVLPLPDTLLNWLPMYGVVRLVVMMGYLLLQREVSKVRIRLM